MLSVMQLIIDLCVEVENIRTNDEDPTQESLIQSLEVYKVLGGKAWKCL